MTSSRNATALICGISGQDGAYLAKLLLDCGYRVCGTSRDAAIGSFERLELLGIRDRIEILSMALNDFRSVLQVIAHVQPGEIYNLAGQSSVGLSFDLPVETLESISVGTLNLLEAIRFLDPGIRLYNAASSECFGDTGVDAASELSPFRPRSPYAVAKAAAYWQIATYREAYRLHACSGILFNHESPLRSERFVTQKIASAAVRISLGSDEKLRLGDISIERDWGWAPEYVEAMWLMMQQDQPGDFVIATGQSFTLQSFVEQVFASLDLDWRDYTIIDASLFRPADIKYSRANAAKAREVLDWSAAHAMPDVADMMVQGRRAQTAKPALENP